MGNRNGEEGWVKLPFASKELNGAVSLQNLEVVKLASSGPSDEFINAVSSSCEKVWKMFGEKSSERIPIP